MKETEMFFSVPRGMRRCFSAYSLPGSWLMKMCQAVGLKWSMVRVVLDVSCSFTGSF